MATPSAEIGKIWLNERRDVDQTRNRDGSVGGLGINAGNVQLDVSGQGFDQQLGVLDVGDQRNSVVNSHTTGLVTLRDVVGWSSESVGRWQVDVQVNQVLGQMFGQGVLGLLVFTFFVQDFQVLDWDTVFVDEIRGSGGSDVTFNDLDFVVLGDELNVVWTSDVQGLTDLSSGNDDSLDGFWVQVLRWNDQSSITGVDTSIFNVFRDNVHDQFTISGNSIHFNFFGVFQVLGDDDWVVSGNF
ncbi:hypothetical protein WICPIJ_000721, partial [Wickerhamomyces pijperi]